MNGPLCNAGSDFPGAVSTPQRNSSSDMYHQLFCGTRWEDDSVLLVSLWMSWVLQGGFPLCLGTQSLQVPAQKWVVTAGFAWLLGTTNTPQRTLLLSRQPVSIATYWPNVGFQFWHLNNRELDELLQIWQSYSDREFSCKLTYLK